MMFSKLARKVKKRVRDNKQIQRNMRDIRQMIDVSVRVENLQNLSINSDSRLTSNEKLVPSELIVSLTTFSKKINEVHLVIESIGLQSVKPNRIILWLDQDEFSLQSIPAILKKQMGRGLEIRFCENYRSYKKIIPTLLENPEAYIITVDDDVIYPADMIDIFIREHRITPDVILGNRAHRIKFDSGNNVLPYKQWEHSTTESESTHQIMLTGCLGVFYPPKSLHPDVINTQLFSELCPFADDLWLKIMALRNNTLNKRTDYSSECLPLKNNRDIGLAKQNVADGGNDRQFKKLLEYYSLTHSDFCR